MKRINTALLGVAMILMVISIAGCSKPNPLLTDNNVNTLKDELSSLRFLDSSLTDPNQLVIHCPDYLANPSSNPSMKNQCEKWSEETYKLIMNKGEIPYKTTLEQFNDPALWKAIQIK